MGILRNTRHELYAQGVAKGLDKPSAFREAGFTGKQYQAVDRRPEVGQRIRELVEASANRAMLSRKIILERILEDWDSARRLGQMASALKAGEMMGKELHKMFVDRKEVGGPGDFDNKSEEELLEIIRSGLNDIGINPDTVTPDNIPNLTKGNDTVN